MTTKDNDTLQGANNDDTLKGGQSAEEREAEEAFASGFKKVAGNGNDADTTTDDTTTGTTGAAADTKTAAAPAGEKKTDTAAAPAAAAPAKDPWEGVPLVVRQEFEASAKRLRNIEGHIGGITSKLDTAISTAKTAAEKKGADAPSKTQVQAAMADPEAWTRLKEDFPDWAGPMEKELNAIRAQLAATGGTVDVEKVRQSIAPDLKAVAREAREFAKVDIKHEGWEETVKTPQFADWLGTQPADVKALADSDRGSDAIKLLDAYTAHQAEAGKKTGKKTDRLAAAAVPDGRGGGDVATGGISDEEAFNRGYKRVAGAKK